MNRSPHEKKDDLSVKTGMTGGKIAKTYQVASLVTLILTVLFVLMMILFQNEHMRPLNVRYLFKYLSPSSLSRSETEIAYATGSGSRFALYHDDLAVIGEGGIALYNPTGDLRFRDDIEKGSAVTRSDGKYLAVYVPGKKQVSLFHSFGKEAELSFASPISAVAVSESGVSAVCLQSKNGASLSLLNSKHIVTATVSPGHGIPVELAISPRGDMTAVLMLSTENGVYRTRVVAFSHADGELLFEKSFEGVRPLGFAFFKNGHMAVIVTGGVVFFSPDGDVTETVSVNDDIAFFAASDRQLAILSERNRLTLFHMKGKTVFYDREVSSIRALKISEEYIFLLGTETLTVLDQKGDRLSSVVVPDGTSDFFILYDESILFCTPTEARQIYIKP